MKIFWGIGLCACFAMATACWSKVVCESTDSGYVLENDRIRMLFDRSNGSLRSLINLSTGDEYLKNPGTRGNPFRLYVNTTELPWFMKTDQVSPEPGNLGGILVDPADCVLEATAFTVAEEMGVLRLDYRHPETAIACELKVEIPDSDDAVTFSLLVRNDSSEKIDLMAGAPYFSGLGLGATPESNLAVRLHGFGQSRGEAWANAGGIYGWQWGGQWNAVYDRGLQEGLGLIVRDTSMQGKAICRHPGGVLNTIYFEKRGLAPGESTAYPEADILVHRGDWKVVGRRYGKWFRSSYPLREQPDWFDRVDLFLGSWIPHPDTVARDSREPETKRAFPSFSQLARLYLPNQYDLMEWAQYWEGVRRHQVYDAFNHTDGIYDLRGDCGGPKAFQEGTVGVERLGRVVGLYVASLSVRPDSLFFQEPYPGAGTQPRDWLGMKTPGEDLPVTTEKGDRTVHMCVRYTPWQDHLAATIQRLLRETGARYVRIDEFASTFLPCWNPAHHHPDPFEAMPEVMEFLRKIRAAIDEVDPEIVLFTEGATDMLALCCDGTLNLWAPGPDLSPMRLVLPSYIGLSYHLGQVDCALNGFVCGTEYACNRYGWWNPYHGALWSPGLEKEPKGYPKPPEGGYLPWPGGRLRWHELGASFVKAARHGDPVDLNPEGVGQDPEEWTSRLWRSEDYWLLVCGNRGAVRPEAPVRVRLHELPAEICHAYEFDVETLDLRDARLERSEEGIFLTVEAGFSAVLLPTPRCPALVAVEGLDTTLPLRAGTSRDLRLEAFAPWSENPIHPRVSVSLPGLSVSPSEVDLPTEVTVEVPPTTEPGNYKLWIEGEALPFKRWVTVE